VKQRPVLDEVLCQGLSTTCRYTCGVGIATIQVGLYTGIWQATHQAFLAALAAAAWLAGGLFATVSSGRRLSPRMSSSAFVALTLLGGIFSCLLSFPQAARLGLSLVLALFLGWIGAIWLQNPAPGWPEPTERARLSLGLCSTVWGLLITWFCRQVVAPDWEPLSTACGLGLLLPLLGLTWSRSERLPFPPSGSNEERRYRGLLDRGRDLASDLACTVDPAALPTGWWLCYLHRRGQLTLVLSSSLFAALELALWSALPTPFAGQLPARTRLFTLCWLLAGQIVACGLACGLLARPLRSIIGRSGRLLPAWFAPWALPILLLLEAVAACCLAALSLPTEDVRLLAVLLAGYTLASFFAGVFLPRARPSLDQQGWAAFPALATTSFSRLLAVRTAEEALAEQARAQATTWLALVLAPGIGLLIDHTSVDGALLVVSLALLASALTGLLLSWRSREEKPLGYWFSGLVTPAMRPAYRGSVKISGLIEPAAATSLHPKRTAHLEGKALPTTRGSVPLSQAIEERNPYDHHHSCPIVPAGPPNTARETCSSPRR